jgi:DNA-binding NarL/FixJ family response regulator
VVLLLADDHALVREGLKHTLAALVPRIEFLEAATAEDVVDHLAGNDAIGLVLLDLVMPGSNGFDLLNRVCDDYPDLPVVILSASADPGKMRKALDIGAAGFITKSATTEVMLSALRLVLAGGIYVPPDTLKTGQSTENEQPAPAVEDRVPPAPRYNSLTSRQRDVLRRIGEGKSNKQIARELALSENTVKIHVAAILRVLGVDNRTQAAVLAREQRIGAAGEG